MIKCLGDSNFTQHRFLYFLTYICHFHSLNSSLNKEKQTVCLLPLLPNNRLWLGWLSLWTPIIFQVVWKITADASESFHLSSWLCLSQLNMIFFSVSSTRRSGFLAIPFVMPYLTFVISFVFRFYISHLELNLFSNSFTSLSLFSFWLMFVLSTVYCPMLFLSIHFVNQLCSMWLLLSLHPIHPWSS